MNKSRNRNVGRIVAVVATIVVITALFLLLVETDEVLRQLATANLRLLLAASGALILGLLAFAVRWRALLGNNPQLLFTFHASNLGHAGNIIIPFRAGEPIRILVMGSGSTVSFTAATTSVIVERLFEQVMRLLALGAAVFVGVGLELNLTTVLSGIGFLAIGFGAVAWLVAHQEYTLSKGVPLLARLPRVTEENARSSLADLLENLKAVANPRQFAKILLLSLLTWFLFGGFFYLTLRALGSSFAPEQQLAVSLGALALSPPSAPTQPGLFHASVVAPLAALGFDPESLTAYAVLLHIQEMFWIILLAIWALFATGSSVGKLFRARGASSASDPAP